ncbi:hypothetical protein ABPG75_013858 [Micractinium tetrahymenae]
MDTVRARWVAAQYVNQPVARCGHSAVAVQSETWGEEFLVVFGGINERKEALDDLAVLQCDQEAWFAPDRAAVGPAARAFHAAAAVGRRMYMFGGHVFVRQQHKIHQFNDLWCLDTDTWEWSRLSGDAPDAPQPCPRDRASMVAVGDSKLLVVGGADAMNRRLDDAWVFNLEAGSWSEVKVAGPRPRARCCTALFALEHRVLMFGGDAYGVTNELWSLRGLEGKEPAQWTQLQLEGPPPAPRRGHAVAVTGNWVVFVGGLTEQRTLMGIKSRSEYLSDVVILERHDRVAWRGVEPASPGPSPREKHTLTALAGGRLLLFGGTDGQTTLGDSWWLDLEDIVPPQPDLISLADLAEASSQPLPDQVAAPTLPLPSGKQPPSPIAVGGGGGVQLQQAQQQQAQQQASASASALTGGLAYLQQSLPALANAGSTALSSLRGRLGLPANPSASALGATAAAQQQAASISEEADEGLLELGQRALAAAGSTASGQADTRRVVAAARQWLATCSPSQLRLADLPVLMADYCRLARLGWSMLLRERGPDALAEPGLQMPGRFMHLPAEELRMREVPEVLADYQFLYASHASLAGAAAGPAATAGAAAAAQAGPGVPVRPGTPVS